MSLNFVIEERAINVLV